MSTPKPMKAIVINAYGSPDVLEVKEVAEPAIKENEVLVRVHAASLNAGDVFAVRGSPWLIRLRVGFPDRRTTFWAGTWPERRGGRQQRDAVQAGRRGVRRVQGALAEYVRWPRQAGAEARQPVL